MEPFWQTLEFQPGETRHWQLGPLEFWIRRIPGEWHLLSSRTPDTSLDHRWLLAASAPFPDSLPFQRFSMEETGSPESLTLRPSFPDRSIVSRPESAIEIPSGASARFVCGVPLQIELHAGVARNSYPLTTLPIRQLNRTWFGTPMEGEACYATQTRAVRHFQDLTPLHFRALCPVHIVNRIPENLTFNRICLRVRHLSLYQGTDHLWSNEIRITRSRIQDASEVAYSPQPPAFESGATLVRPPLEKPNSSLLLRTFNNLRQLTDLP